MPGGLAGLVLGSYPNVRGGNGVLAAAIWTYLVYPRVCGGTLARLYHPHCQRADGYKTHGVEGHQYTAAFLGGGAPESVGVYSSDAGSEEGDDEGSADVAGF